MKINQNFHSYDSFSDEQLVELFIHNKQRDAAFNEIMNRYRKRVYFHVRNLLHHHEDADDAAQNTFVKIWEKLDGFKGQSKLYSWIYRIATNEALTILRKQRPGISLEDHLPVTHSTTFGDGESAKGIQLKLSHAMSELPLKQKLVFYLKYFEELSYDQIAEITETSVGALKASYFHAVKKIEQHLEQSL